MRKRANRICVDLDYPSRLQLLKTYFNASAVFPVVITKETGHGVHFRIMHLCPDIDKNLDVRRHLGDDPGRICFDENRRVLAPGWVDTAFNFKFKNGVLTYEQPYDVLMLPSITQLPARKKH